MLRFHIHSHAFTYYVLYRGDAAAAAITLCRSLRSPSETVTYNVQRARGGARTRYMRGEMYLVTVMLHRPRAFPSPLHALRLRSIHLTAPPLQRRVASTLPLESGQLVRSVLRRKEPVFSEATVAAALAFSTPKFVDAHSPSNILIQSTAAVDAFEQGRKAPFGCGACDDLPWFSSARRDRVLRRTPAAGCHVCRRAGQQRCTTSGSSNFLLLGCFCGGG
jgi:hypothetical protein